MKKYIIALLVLFLLLVGCIGAAETGRLTFWQGIGLAGLCFASNVRCLNLQQSDLRTKDFFFYDTKHNLKFSSSQIFSYISPLTGADPVRIMKKKLSSYSTWLYYIDRLPTGRHPHFPDFSGVLAK